MKSREEDFKAINIYLINCGQAGLRLLKKAFYI